MKKVNIYHITLKHCLFFCGICFLFACSNNQIKKEHSLLAKGDHISSGLEMYYPNNGTIFPPEFPAPQFEWEDMNEETTEWHVFLSDKEGNIEIASKAYDKKWRPEQSDWNKIKTSNIQKELYFTAISNKKSDGKYASCRIQFSISSDSVGADIFYRAVTLPFSYAVKNVHTIEWYLGSVDGSKPRKMIDNLPVCGNCHSFAQEQPLLAMDVDYGNDKGSYVIANTIDTCNLKPDNIITWSDFKKDEGDPTFGLLSQISPDGNFVLSTVKDLSIFVAVDNNMAYSQLFFPIQGIIGIYDRVNESFNSLSGANDPKFVQSNPTWSPNGEKIVFAKTEAYVNEKVKEAGIALLTLDDVNEFTSGEKEFKYDLYTIDFNKGKGGKAEPLKGASNNGKSNYFPKFSPDGRWIVFCQAENFMLLQPDSRLYIMPSEGGEPRLMNCNMDEMNSWHSWSPNGKWLVFSSKNRGLYTQLYLTHIDENGIDSPPVLLENLSFEKRAANIPEFYPFDGDDFKLIKDNFSSTPEYFNSGAFDKISNKYYLRAMADLDKALAIDSNYLETYFNKIMLNNLLRQVNSKEDMAIKNKAMQLVEDTLRRKPNDENFLSLKVSLLSNMGKQESALTEALTAVQKHPNSYKLYDLLGTLYRKSGKYQDALNCYNKLLKIDPSKNNTINNLKVNAYIRLKRTNNALAIINKSLLEHPENPDLLFMKAQVLLEEKQFANAKKEIDKLYIKDSTNTSYNELLAQYYLGTGNNNQYANQKRNILRLLNAAYTKNSENTDVIFEMASTYMLFKDYLNADRMYDTVLKAFPNNYEALKQKAVVKLSMQNWAEAISFYNRLEENYPLEEGFLNNKAIAYIQLKDYEKALEYFSKTLDINPNNKDAIYNRNRLKLELAGKN